MHQRLLDECERFLLDFQIAPSRFGRQACRDPRFIFQLRRGREPTGRVADRVFAFMRRTREAEARSQQQQQKKGTRDGKKGQR